MGASNNFFSITRTSDELSISAILTQKGISIFAISTYDTDYIFVKNKDIDNTIQSLIKERYEIIY